MSLPKLASSPPLSSSPSKQSIGRPLTRPNSIDQPTQTNDALDDHTTPANIESHLAEEDIEQGHHKLHSASQILYQPFFTVIEDAHTSEYYHPTVHYIFSDDDTDIVTEAALRSLETEQDDFPNTKGKARAAPENQHPQDPEGDADEDDTPTRRESLLPDPVPGVRDNYIILDIDHVPGHGHGGGAGSPDITQQDNLSSKQQTMQQEQQPSPHQFTVTSAQSLSPSWQVLNTQILPAPTFENNSSGEKGLSGGLMLQIQGTSGLPMGLLGKDKERGSQRLEDMMGHFARRLDELRRVIESGERGMPSGVEGSLHDIKPLEEPSTQDPPDIPLEAQVEQDQGDEGEPRNQ